MAFESYQYTVDQANLSYEFISVGSKGEIRKAVRFTKRQTIEGEVFYNLGLGDWSDAKQRWDDFATSGNSDAEKVMMTVAAIVMDFTQQNLDAIIYAEGTTKSRTRLYQINLNKFHKEIAKHFEIFGFQVKQGWEPFKPEINYDAFLAKRIK